jgi:hypothetical protein
MKRKVTFFFSRSKEEDFFKALWKYEQFGLIKIVSTCRLHRQVNFLTDLSTPELEKLFNEYRDRDGSYAPLHIEELQACGCLGMIITSHQQLDENRKALQTLIDEGMTTSEEYVRRSNAVINIAFTRCVSLKYATLMKESFFECTARLQKQHLIGAVRACPTSYRAEINTCLTDAELHQHFDQYSEGTLCIAERSCKC